MPDNTWENRRKRYDVEDHEDWIKTFFEVPAFTVPDGCTIKVAPPFGGAVARFRIIGYGKDISVYLDTQMALGSYSGPYWEAYPIDGDTVRYPMADIDKLMSCIECEILGEKEGEDV